MPFSIANFRSLDSYLSLLPTLGPAQMVQRYVNGPYQPGIIDLNRQYKLLTTIISSSDLRLLGFTAERNLLLFDRVQGLKLFASDFTPCRQFSHPNRYSSVSIAANGNICCFRSQLTVEILDGLTLSLMKQLPVSDPGMSPAAIIGYTPDNRVIMRGVVIPNGKALTRVQFSDSQGRLMHHFDVPDKKALIKYMSLTNQLAVLSGHEINLSPINKIKQYSLRVYDLEGKIFRDLQIHGDCFNFDIDGEGNVIVVDFRGDVHLYDAQDQYVGHLKNIHGHGPLCIDDEGRILVANSQGIEVWGPQNGGQVH